MTISLYAASVPVFVQMLTALKAVLLKAEAQAADRKFAPEALLQARLYPNMFAFTRQVQIATDFAKGTCARLAGLEPPQYPDTEQSFADLVARIERTLEFLGTLSPAQIDGQEARQVELRVGGRVLSFQGLPYLLHFSLPNFYFHVTTAYAILRHNGIEIGKMDFVGQFQAG